jgi:hypothetical protein
MPLSTDPAIGDGQPPAGWERTETLGVSEVVLAILKARKVMPTATAATVSRQMHGDAFHVRVSLMNDPLQNPEGSPPGEGETGGHVAVIADFIARQLGQDLIDAFGGKDVIILK